MNKRIYQIILLLSFVVFVTPLFGADEIYLHHTEGISYDDPNTIIADRPIAWHFFYKVESGVLGGSTNAYKVWSPDGATWEPITMTANPMLSMFYDGGIFIQNFSITGSGADTIGFGAFKLFSTGIIPPFDDWAVTVHTSVSSDMIGKTICIDSSFYPPAGPWLWNLDTGSLVPGWSGPHCFEIVDCCSGIRGNVRDSGEDLINIGDIDYFVQYMFFGTYTPDCMLETDVNGDGEVNISDLSFLVDYMFLFGPPPPSCP